MPPPEDDNGLVIFWTMVLGIACAMLVYYALG